VVQIEPQNSLSLSTQVNVLTKKRNKRGDGQLAKQIPAANANNSRATKNITRMVIFHALLNVTGTVPFTIYFILNSGKLVAATQQFNDFTQVAVIFLYGAPGLNLFIYYLFNKLYKEVFQGYFKKIFFFIY
jgi:hypothetical protein